MRGYEIILCHVTLNNSNFHQNDHLQILLIHETLWANTYANKIFTILRLKLLKFHPIDVPFSMCNILHKAISVEESIDHNENGFQTLIAL
jgi:hypothetical protein